MELGPQDAGSILAVEGQQRLIEDVAGAVGELVQVDGEVALILVATAREGYDL
jgi:hypothetical protein